MKLKPPPASQLKQYHLTQAQWLELAEYQRWKCAICQRPFTMRRTPRVDHDHRTGLVRGLLCNHCNETIGWLHEDTAWLRHAAYYLDGGQPAALLRWRDELDGSALKPSMEPARFLPDTEVDR